MVTCITLGAMFVSQRLPRVAEQAEELQRQRQARQGQAEYDVRAAPSQSITQALFTPQVVQWSICKLTLVDALMWRESEGGAVTYLKTVQQGESASAN